MRNWWKWMGPQVPTETTADTGRCERCHEYAIIFLNGQTLLCWDHYCAEMQRQRAYIKSGDDR
jgi:hypothetical protein